MTAWSKCWHDSVLVHRRVFALSCYNLATVVHQDADKHLCNVAYFRSRSGGLFLTMRMHNVGLKVPKVLVVVNYHMKLLEYRWICLSAISLLKKIR